MARGPKKHPVQPQGDVAQSLIDALASVTFEELPESLLPTSDEVEAFPRRPHARGP